MDEYRMLYRNFLRGLAFQSLLLCAPVVHAVPAVLSDVLVTDVSDRSFSLVWTSDQLGQPSIEVYSDAAATNLLTNVTVAVYPVSTGDPGLTGQARSNSINSIVQAAQALGIVKVSVSGLSPATAYYIKYGFDNNAQEVTLCPDAGAVYCPSATGLVSLQTASAQSRISGSGGTDALFENDQLLLIDQQVQEGELLVIGVEYSSYPISVFVGDGMTPPYVLADVNNLYAQTDQRSMQLRGLMDSSMGNLGEALVVRHYRGQAGSTSQLQTLAAASGSGAVMSTQQASFGDCNGDSFLNGYDALLMNHVVAATFTQSDYANVAFHPLLCNLYSEEGLHNVTPLVNIDAADKSLVDDLLIGIVQQQDLPQVP